MLPHASRLVTLQFFFRFAPDFHKETTKITKLSGFCWESCFKKGGLLDFNQGSLISTGQTMAVLTALRSLKEDWREVGGSPAVVPLVF